MRDPALAAAQQLVEALMRMVQTLIQRVMTNATVTRLLADGTGFEVINHNNPPQLAWQLRHGPIRF